MYLFLDVDGTIINYHAETPVSALEALNKAQQYITDDGFIQCISAFWIIRRVK